MKTKYLAAALSLTACGPEIEYRTATLTHAVTCATPEPVTVGISPATLRHTVNTYADGFVQATCFVADHQSSTTGMAAYGPDQKGAFVGGCMVVHDFDEWSGGWWSFEWDPYGDSTGTYRDSSELNGVEVNMECEVMR